ELYTRAVMDATVGKLTTGGPPGASGRGVPRKVAERGVSLSDPRGGVRTRPRRPATRGPKARTDGRRDREMLDRRPAPDKQRMLPCADRRGEASVGAAGGHTPVTDDRRMAGVGGG